MVHCHQQWLFISPSADSGGFGILVQNREGSIEKKEAFLGQTLRIFGFDSQAVRFKHLNTYHFLILKHYSLSTRQAGMV